MSHKIAKNLIIEVEIEKIVNEISQSKLYQHLSIETIRRVVYDLSHKYNQKNLLKESKNKLHQIWGAFYDGNPNFSKILKKIDGLESLFGTDSDGFKNVNLFSKNNLTDQIKETLIQISKLHSSTRERVAILPGFYDQIFEFCGKIESVVEYGCGLNAISLILSGHISNFKYRGFDIDTAEIEFLNSLLQYFKLYPDFRLDYGDVLDSAFMQKVEVADMTFLLKLLPTLEQQQKNSSLAILNAIMGQPQNKWILVTFPVFSIGRKAKNMSEFYTVWFEDLLTKLENKCRIKKFDYSTELVYILENLS